MKKNEIILGLHAVLALLTHHPKKIRRLAIAKERHDQKIKSLLMLANELSLPIQMLSRAELDTLSQGENHQGVLAFCEASQTYSESDLETLLANLTQPPLLLILDGIQDPHNLGACLRSADAAGVHAVIAPRDKSVGLTTTVCKVASGAAETVPFIQVTNLVRTLEKLKKHNIWIFGGALPGDKNLYEADLTIPLAIVMGAEGKGLRRLTKEHCDLLLTIPMKGTVASLNVSVATGIFLFEAIRQRIG